MPNGPVTEIEETPSGLASLSDEELVDRFLAQLPTDREDAHLCFETLMARYHGLIVHIVRSSQYRFPAWDSIDDVVARVVFKTYRGLGLWRWEGKLSSFIGRIATTEMIDTIRRVRRDKSYNPRPLADPEADEPTEIDRAPSRELSPEARLLHDEQRKIVDQLLADVCRDWKDSVIVNQYLIAGLDAKEISGQYGMSEDVVYQRARRLKVRLMKWLEERGITSAEQLLSGGVRLSNEDRESK